MNFIEEYINDIDDKIEDLQKQKEAFIRANNYKNIDDVVSYYLDNTRVFCQDEQKVNLKNYLDHQFPSFNVQLDILSDRNILKRKLELIAEIKLSKDYII